MGLVLWDTHGDPYGLIKTPWEFLLGSEEEEEGEWEQALGGEQAPEEAEEKKRDMEEAEGSVKVEVEDVVAGIVKVKKWRRWQQLSVKVEAEDMEEAEQEGETGAAMEEAQEDAGQAEEKKRGMQEVEGTVKVKAEDMVAGVGTVRARRKWRSGFFVSWLVEVQGDAEQAAEKKKYYY